MKKLLYICLLFLLCSYNCLYCAYYNNFVDAYGLRWELKADRVEGSQPNWPTNPSVVFKYTAGTSSQTIIFFNMTLTDYYYINPTDSLVTDIVIPSYVNWDSNGSLGVGTGPLQIIESNAFYNKPVTSVDIPSSILTIKLPCFNNCGNLKNIKIDGKDNFTPSFSSPSNYSTLNGVLFNSDKTQLKKYPEGKNDELFKVPQTVSKLDNGCFANTKNLAIQFFGAAPEVHENAFVNSTAVVYYPKGAEGWPDFDGGGYFDEWGVWAYPIGEQDYVTEDGVILRFHKESSSITIDDVIYISHDSCTIPSTIGGYPVTSIGDDAFYYCDGLTSVTIPDSVTSIGSFAFYYCDGLTSITIPDSVTSIGSSAFSRCNEALYDYETIPGVILVDGWVVDYTEECPAELNLIGVRGISGHAFEWCSDLTSITIPDSVTSIGYWAFSGCSNLESITIPDTVTSIDNGAFYGCSGLTSITIPDSVTSIGDYAFNGCSSLKSFSVSPNNPSYKSVDGLLLSKDGKTLIAGINGDIVIPNSVTSIVHRAFDGCSGLTSITIPDSVTNIGSSAFSGCSGLKSFSVSPNNPSYKSVNGLLLSKDGKTLIAGINGDVVIPDTVTSISYYVFSGCSGLTSITIPSSVTSIPLCAFYNCSGLTSVTIPNSVTSIDEGAFVSCSGLTSVTIGNSVTSIDDYAFDGCSGLTEAIFLGDAPRYVGDDIFYNSADDFVIKVKKGTKGWNGDYTSTELPETWYGYPIEYAIEDDLYPVLDANATAEDVANALSGSVDENLAKNITSVEMYNNYREWALSVKAPTGDDTAGVEDVKASTTAWISFALDQSRLIANEPVEGDVSIASLDKVDSDGAFEFTVNIDKIDVGDGAVEENLNKLFKIEGATSLGNDANFSSENVEIELAEPVNGDVKFKIIPKDSPDSFFIKAKLLK